MRRVVVTTALVIFSLVWSSGIAEAVASGDYLDEFSTIAYNGSDGTIDWSPDPWSELGEPDGPTAGQVQVVNNTRCDGGGGNCLRIGDGDEGSISGYGAMREADLDGASSATLSYSYRRQNIDDTSGSVAAEISGDGGGSWTTLASYSLSSSDGTNVVETFDISAYIAANTQIRFIGSGSVEAYIYFDNVKIEAVGNDPPVAVADADTVAEGAAVNVTVLTNDSDPESDPLQITAVSTPSNGTAVINDNGTPGDTTDDYIVYTHNGSETSSDSFTYTISDGTLTDTATVTITVTAVNDPPVLNPVGNKTVEELALLTFTATASPTPTCQRTPSLSPLLALRRELRSRPVESSLGHRPKLKAAAPTRSP